MPILRAVDMATDQLTPGTRIEVRSRFDQDWKSGFEVAGVVESEEAIGYRVRRLSDGAVLPAEFADDDIRRERGKRGLWWY